MMRIGTWQFLRVTVCTLFCMFFVLLQNGTTYATDSCITCHTDEQMLKSNLAKNDAKKSPLQSGPG